MEKKQSVIGIGEALFDVLPEGKKLGGAPANFARACHFRSSTSSSLGS